MFYCVASTTQRSKKNTKRASTRGAFVDVPADALPAIIPGSFTLPPFLALVSLLRSALLCTKPSSTPNLSQLVGEEFGIIVPSSVSVAAVPGERHAPRPALFREQRIFHRYFAGSNLGIFLTLAQEWIISNYLGLGLKCPFLHRQTADFLFFFFSSRKIAFPLSPTEQRNVNTPFKQRGL